MQLCSLGSSQIKFATSSNPINNIDQNIRSLRSKSDELIHSSE
jgi:hypothetical protein